MSKELIDIAEKDRSEWTRTDYDFVKLFLKEKPWFSFGHFLITAIANEIGAYSYKSHLRSAALHAGKRQLLFKYLANEDSEEVLKPVKEENSQFAEITLNRPGEAQEIIPPTEKESAQDVETLGEEIRLNINSEITDIQTDSEESLPSTEEVEELEKEETTAAVDIEVVNKEEKIDSVDEQNESNTEESEAFVKEPENITPTENIESKVEESITEPLEDVEEDVETPTENTSTNETEAIADGENEEATENQTETPQLQEEELAPQEENTDLEIETTAPQEAKTEEIADDQIQKLTNKETAIYDPEKELLKLISEEEDAEEIEENEGSEDQETTLENADTHSFMQWLDLAKAAPKKKKEKKKKGKKKKKKKNKESDSQDPLDHFLKTKPTISRPKREFYNPQNMAQKSDVYDGPITEILAQLYVKQGEIETAIQMYEQLRLQDSSKSAYFASQIKKLKQP